MKLKFKTTTAENVWHFYSDSRTNWLSVNCDKSRMQLLLAAIKEISTDASVAAILSEMVGTFILKKQNKKNNTG